MYYLVLYVSCISMQKQGLNSKWIFFIKKGKNREKWTCKVFLRSNPILNFYVYIKRRSPWHCCDFFYTKKCHSMYHIIGLITLIVFVWDLPISDIVYL